MAFTKSRLEELSEDELARHRRLEDILRMKEGFKLLSNPQSRAKVESNYWTCLRKILKQGEGWSINEVTKK